MKKMYFLLIPVIVWVMIFNACNEIGNTGSDSEYEEENKTTSVILPEDDLFLHCLDENINSIPQYVAWIENDSG